jgi:hypothetical protein
MPGAISPRKKGLLIKQMLLEHFQLDDSRYRDFLRQRQA